MLQCPVEEALVGAKQAGLSAIVTVGIDPASSRVAVELADRYAGRPRTGEAGAERRPASGSLPAVVATVGLHPHDAHRWDDETAHELLELAADQRVVAVGECGLDLFRDRSPRAAQEAAFRGQIEVARAVRKPLVVHVRDAGDQALELLARHADGLTVIMHCFSLAGREAECNERGYYASFAGNVTFKKAEELRRAARLIADDRLLVETDAPFLSPVPHRGKDNLPERVTVTAAALAAERGWDETTVDMVTSANARRAFSLPDG